MPEINQSVPEEISLDRNVHSNINTYCVGKKKMYGIVVLVITSVCFGAIVGISISGDSNTKGDQDAAVDVRECGDPDKPLYLTGLIESGRFVQARHCAMVHYSEINMTSYAGYFTVDKKYNSNLFFWYFPSQAKLPNLSENDPVLLWLQGGPGEPSTLGLFLQNGPYQLDSNQKLRENKYSWNIGQNLLYIDSPVGSGYSFTNSDNGYATNEKNVSSNLLGALQQFFLMFPELQTNEFFVAGESYAGKYVPAIGYAIYQDSLRKTVDPRKPKINLKGLGIGNGFSDPIHQLNYGDYLYQIGLVDLHGRQILKDYENRCVDCIQRNDYNCAYEVFDKLILAAKSPDTVLKNLTGFDGYYNFLTTQAPDYTSFDNFMQSSEIRRAIHVGNNSYSNSDGFGKVADFLRLDFLMSVADYVSELLSHYSVFVYNGQLDIVVAYILSENYLLHLNFSAAQEFKTADRCMWHVDNRIAGYSKQAGNLTQILVRDAGHSVPADQPAFGLDLILHLTQHKKLC